MGLAAMKVNRAQIHISDRVICSAIRAMIDLRLVIPKDSPNGKRHAIRDGVGAVVDAFGFDMTTVYAKRKERTESLAERKRLKEALNRLFDEITVHRRVTEKALDVLAQPYSEIDRSDLERRSVMLKARAPNRSRVSLSGGLVEAWKEARHFAEEAFYKARCDSTNAGTLKKKTGFLAGKTRNNALHAPAHDVGAPSGSAQNAPELLVEACPIVSYYGHPTRDAGGNYRSFVSMISRGRINLQSELLPMRRRKLG
jgi:replication initiation protein RepC